MLAMAMSVLGETLDIHTGGIDHIPVHTQMRSLSLKEQTVSVFQGIGFTIII